MRRKIQIATGAYVLAVTAALGLGVNLALADPASETASARACDLYTCQLWCAPAEGQCNQITNRCVCK